MLSSVNIYCDESCHLENDNINVMVLGAISCPTNKVKLVNKNIKEIKSKYNVKNIELKWIKISPSLKSCYLELIQYFFTEQFLSFRALIVNDKNVLDHKRFNQTHDDWYYKMYYTMLRNTFNTNDELNIYIDIKDSNSSKKARKLGKICQNSIYDYRAERIKKIQPIRSNEVEIMQITDVLIGALAYNNRIFPLNHHYSETKKEIIAFIKENITQELDKTSVIRESKFNLFYWKAR